MSEAKTASPAKKDGKKDKPKEKWFEGVKGEFSRITWLEKGDVARQTTAVVIVSVVVGFIIAILDRLIQSGINILTGI